MSSARFHRSPSVSFLPSHCSSLARLGLCVLTLLCALSALTGCGTGVISACLVSASSCSTGTGSTTGATSATIQIQNATYSVSEGAGSVVLSVTRVGSATGAASATFSTANGTALSGVAYTSASGTLTWADGDSTAKTITVGIADQSLSQGNQTFTVTLNGVTGSATLGTVNSATVTILDNDVLPGFVQFSAPAYSASASAASVPLTVTRTNGTTGAVTVQYQTVDGTATAGKAYASTTGTLTWADGDSSSKTILVPLVTQAPFTGSETFAVTLSNLTGDGSLGSPSTSVVTLSSNNGPVSLMINNLTGIRIRVNNTSTFSATLTGASNSAINWQLNGVLNGNAQLGTITPNSDGSITYTAPAVVPTPNVLTLTASSVMSPAATDSREIVVLNPVPTLTAITPQTTNPGSVPVTLTGSNFLSSALFYVNGAPTPVTWVSPTQLTANLNLNTAGNYLLQVANPDPGYSATGQLELTINGNPPPVPVTPEAASRFLDQATFGATPGDIQNLSNIGYQAWLNQQFALPNVSHVPYINQELQVDVPPACAPTDVKCNTALYQTSTDDNGIAQSFFIQAVTGQDQLRQRVAYSLSQFLVISNSGGATFWQARGFGAYLDVLENDAFGNFRTLLQDVTLNAQMGQFLNVLGNEGQNPNIHPDENYAREVMQLFTIGLYQLNPDGTNKLDPTGNLIPTYGNADVQGLASVFTGFSYNVPAGAPDNYTPNDNVDWNNGNSNVGSMVGFELLPMKSYPSHHSTAEKDFLGVTIPASPVSDPDGDLKIALDTIFNHPNLPPFVCKQLIQHMVTSNPSPAYVQRVAQVFVDDGTGVRGNMQAVITAILLDPEAMNATAAYSNPQAGKIRESLIRYLEWARAFSAQSYTGVFEIGSPENNQYGLGEMALRSPSVFNWFQPSYIPPNTTISAAGLVSPELQMTDVVSVVGYMNYMEDVVAADSTSYTTGGSDVFSSYSAEVPLANNPQQLINHISLLLLAGNMSADLQQEILTAVNSVGLPTNGTQDAMNQALLLRVKIAVFLTISSPEFAAQI